MDREREGRPGIYYRDKEKALTQHDETETEETDKRRVESAAGEQLGEREPMETMKERKQRETEKRGRREKEESVPQKSQ